MNSFLRAIHPRALRVSTRWLRIATPSRATEIPDGAQFLNFTFSGPAGSRHYKLYVPSTYQGLAVPLIVMLHGCTQSAADFAAGTRMNAAAEERCCLVAYPEQPTSANMKKCWNWFNPNDQHRGAGEPSLIAGITHEVMSQYAVDPQRVFIAGLSAGGAAAAILANTYPDIYAAIGIHSGLPYGSAHDVGSAFAAMGGNPEESAPSSDPVSANPRVVPTIIFHGDKDETVDVSNANVLVLQCSRGRRFTKRTVQSQSAEGVAYSQTLHNDAAGNVVIENWTLHGGGHAWSGGSPAGSHTMPHGPDATQEMLRFFMQQRLPR